MLSAQDILCFSSIDWDFIWQGHQEIMTRLASQGNRILFIENTGIRPPGLRDLPRLKHRFMNWWRSTKGFRREQDNLFIYSPLLLPFPYAWLARRINRFLLLRALRRWMQAAHFRRPLVWTFLPTPLVRDIIKSVDPLMTVYYCIDDFVSSSPAAQRISRSETKLFREADLVFVTSEQLRLRAAGLSDRVYLFPFGVNFERFEAVRNVAATIPEELARLPQPVVGYVGGIHQWVDQDLLGAVAQRMPEASFVLVGPPQTDVSRLKRFPNVHVLGAKPHAEIPRYTRGFRVGIVPYRRSAYTDHVYPTKLNEYLAMGLPVVATPLPEIARFNKEHQDVVSMVPDVEGFVRAIREAIGETQPETVRRRIDVARQNGWEERVERMSELIAERLRAKALAGGSWQESLRRLYRGARWRLTGVVASGAVVYLLLFRSPLVWWLAQPLAASPSRAAAEAIVVLAGGVGESGKAGEGSEERIKHAVDLYRQGRADYLVLSSGYQFAFKEPEVVVMKQLAVGLGVPASAILLEIESRNTHDNARLVGEILREREWHSILLVSSPYHMRRALATFRKLVPGIRAEPAPVPHSQFYSHKHGATLAQILGILHEYGALLYYWANEWV